jgi:hypothetical protein
MSAAHVPDLMALLRQSEDIVAGVRFPMRF